jgi:hypothetical protein
MGDKFELGRIVATPAALKRAEEQGLDVTGLLGLLARHAAGDWGDLDTADKRANEQALRSGARILSAYGRGAAKLYLITEAATDACPACHGYGGACEPEKGEWLYGAHYRTDLPERRHSTTIMRPEDY